MIYADNSIVSNSGSSIIPVYGPKVQKDGSLDVVKVGEEDFDAYIQSFVESTDISFILAKLASGDDSVLKQHVGSYGDFTKVPSTFAEVLQLQIDAGLAFDRLPVEVKREFNNDLNQWLAVAGTPEWASKMESVLDPETLDLLRPVVADPVKESEVSE